MARQSSEDWNRYKNSFDIYESIGTGVGKLLTTKMIEVKGIPYAGESDAAVITIQAVSEERENLPA